MAATLPPRRRWVDGSGRIDEDGAVALPSDYDLAVGEEGAQLQAFLAAPDDPGTLATYLAFLDAEDPPRAGVLRQLQRCRKASSTAEAQRFNAALDDRASQLGGPRATWWQIVRDAGSVRGCGAAKDEPLRVRFTFRCPKTWASLAETADPNVRHCELCEEQVFHCATPAEVARRARLGQCVSVPPEVAERGQRDAMSSSSYLGRPDPLECWADAVFKR
jgi:hypothetical protein